MYQKSYEEPSINAHDEQIMECPGENRKCHKKSSQAINNCITQQQYAATGEQWRSLTQRPDSSSVPAQTTMKVKNEMATNPFVQYAQKSHARWEGQRRPPRQRASQPTPSDGIPVLHLVGVNYAG